MHAAYFHPLWLSVRILIGVRALSVAESDEVHTVDGNVVFCYEVAINRFSKVLGALDPGAACQRRMRFQFEDVAVLTVDAGGQIVELEARVRGIRNFQNPGEFDYAGFSARNGIYWTASATGASVVAQQAGADPGAVVFDALQSARSRGTDVLIADTAGRLQNQTHLMEELKKVRRVLQRVDPSAPQEVLLVLDANQGQNALAQAVQFHEAIGVTGLVLTKLDGTAKGGIVLAIARKLKLPIRFIGIGEQAADFGEFNAAAFAAALVGGDAPPDRPASNA